LRFSPPPRRTGGEKLGIAPIKLIPVNDSGFEPDYCLEQIRPKKRRKDTNNFITNKINYEFLNFELIRFQAIVVNHHCIAHLFDDLTA